MKSKKKYFSFLIDFLKSIFKNTKNENTEQNNHKNVGVIEIVEQILEIKELKVSEVMIPRADVVAINADSSLENIKEKFLQTGFLRLLIYGKDLDDIIGFIHMRNIFEYLCNSEKPFLIENFLMKTIYAARSSKCLQLLQKMNQEECEIAVILDEYGGIEGVVSIEKLEEQILNVIQDTSDEEEESNLAIQQIHDNVYILDARTSIQKIEEIFDDVEFLSEEEGEYETLGGFILSYLDRVPSKGEKFTHVGGLEVEILESTNRAIQTVKITRIKTS